MAKPPTILRRMDPKASLARAVDAARIIFLGEVHHEPLLGFQTAVIGAASAGGRRPVHVVLEHFACDQQPLLDRFKAGQLSVSELGEAYRSTGTEGFDVEGHYSRLLTYGRDRCRFYGGFLPKREAKGFVGGGDPEGWSTRLREAVQRRYLLPEATRLAVSEDSHRVVLRAGEGASEDNRCLEGTDSHYYFFESLIMGRGADTRAEEPGSLPPLTGRFRKIFSAQIVKDLSMASAVVRVWRDIVNSPGREDADAKVVAIMGNGHMEYGFGVPERVQALLSNSRSSPGDEQAAFPEVLHVVCHANTVEGEEEPPPDDRLRPAVFPDGSRRAPADFVYLYDTQPVAFKTQV